MNKAEIDGEMPDFQIVSDYGPTGDQPQAIDMLAEGVKCGKLPL